MQLVEKHIINSGNEYFKEIDELSFKSKNLYNFALYQIRQEFINNGTFLKYMDLYRSIRYLPDYQALPDKVSKGILLKLYDNFYSFFEAIKDYQKNPKKYNSKPRIPQYLDKVKGRNIVIYDKEALNRKGYKNTGLFKLSKTNILIKSKIHIRDIKQVHITKMSHSYKISVIYVKMEEDLGLDRTKVASIDLGLNNLATLVSNVEGYKPRIYNGKKIKSINQGCNKRIAKYKSELPYRDKTDEKNYKVFGDKKVLKQVSRSKKIEKEYDKRSRRIDDCFHKTSNDIVNQLVSNNIGTLVIGYNKGWKQDINIGSENNQKFVCVPHLKLVEMLAYKCKLLGIVCVTINEAYTSKCSFIDNEDVCKHDKYKGKRIKRGLFKTNKGKLINADVNAAYNILSLYSKKVFLDFKYKIGATSVSTIEVINR